MPAKDAWSSRDARPPVPLLAAILSVSQPQDSCDDAASEADGAENRRPRLADKAKVGGEVGGEAGGEVGGPEDRDEVGEGGEEEKRRPNRFAAASISTRTKQREGSRSRSTSGVTQSMTKRPV